MLDAYDGAALHPRSKPAFRDERGQFVCIDATGADPKPTDCLYHFNSLGYRSEEFDPTARLKIFVSGCSYTFGLGMEPDQAWPGLLKKMVADKLGVPLDRANLQNFSPSLIANAPSICRPASRGTSACGTSIIPKNGQLPRSAISACSPKKPPPWTCSGTCCWSNGRWRAGESRISCSG